MITARDFEWTAGFLEGEGSFLADKKGGSIRVVAGQVQVAPLTRLKTLFGGTLHVRKLNGRPQNQPVWMWCLSGVAAAGLAMTMYPLMSPRRQEQIRLALQVWKSHPCGAKYRPKAA